MSESTRGVLLSAPTFDPSLVEILVPLHVGGTLHVVENRVVLTPASLFSALKDFGITLVMATPSLLSRFQESHMNDILQGRTCIMDLAVGGEQFPIRFWNKYGTTIRLWNLYGTTETSIWASLTPLGIYKDFKKELDCGIEMALEGVEFDIRSIDSSTTPSTPPPFSALPSIGELWIGVRPDRVCDIANMSIISRGDAPLFFPSGDLVGNCNGRITYKGRLNAIVKRSGKRINLEDIDKQFAYITGVKQCWYIDR